MPTRLAKLQFVIVGIVGNKLGAAHLNGLSRRADRPRTRFERLIADRQLLKGGNTIGDAVFVGLGLFCTVFQTGNVCKLIKKLFGKSSCHTSGTAHSGHPRPR